MECFEPRRVGYEFYFEKASATPACFSSLPANPDPLQIEEGEEVRFCIFINNSTNQTLTSHKVTIPGSSEVKTLSIPGNSSDIIHFSGPIEDSIDVPVSITSYGGAVAEGDFVDGTTYEIVTSSILDFLPAIISGALKKTK